MFKKSRVSEVRGPTQPEGKAIPEFTLSGQGRALADKLTLAIEGLAESQPRLGELEEGIQRLTDGLGQISAGNALAAEGSGQIQERYGTTWVWTGYRVERNHRTFRGHRSACRGFPGIGGFHRLRGDPDPHPVEYVRSPSRQ